MKSPINVLLVLLLGGTLSSCFAESGDASSQKHWGDVVDGFQMAIILDQTNGLIHCRIRNATTNEIDYPSFDFGYVEFVHLQVQGPANWVNTPGYMYPVMGASDGCPYFTKIFQPGETVTDYFWPWPVLAFKEYLQWSHGNTNEALLTQQENKWFADRVAKCRDDTFAFDLVEMDWPTNLLCGKDIKMRASQLFRPQRNKDTTEILYSGELTLDAPLVRSFINQKNKLPWKSPSK